MRSHTVSRELGAEPKWCDSGARAPASSCPRTLRAHGLWTTEWPRRELRVGSCSRAGPYGECWAIQRVTRGLDGPTPRHCVSGFLRAAEATWAWVMVPSLMGAASVLPSPLSAVRSWSLPWAVVASNALVWKLHPPNLPLLLAFR